MRYLLIIVALMAVGCGSDSPTTPTPVVPACQTNNTAALSFENRSVNSFTFDVFVDNARVAVIGPTQTSSAQTVVAGVQHTARFLVTNTGFVACTVSPIPVRCSTQTYFCTF